MKKKKLLYIVLFILGLVLYTAFLYHRISRIPCNSDTANMILEADSILHGNLFLSDWHLTGITFFTTDLPFFVIGVLIAGVSVQAGYIAITLMYVFMILAALLLIKGKRDNLLNFLVFAGIALIPSTFTLDAARVHTALFALAFIAIHFAAKALEEPKKKYYILFGIFTALAVCGDYLGLVVITVPILLLCIANKVKKPIQLAIATLVGTAGGVVLEHVFLLLGNANKNSLLAGFFLQINEIGDSIILYIRSMTHMMNANFFGKELFSIKTPIFAIRVLLLLFVFYIMAVQIRKLFRSDGKTCFVSTTLSLSFAILTAFMLLTEFGPSLTSARYILYFPTVAAILIVLYYREKNIYEQKFYENRLPVKMLIGVLSVTMLGACYFVKVPPSSHTVFNRLTEFLQEESLTNGYATFWDASIVTVLSQDQVKVRAIESDEKGLQPQYWFCQNNWYDEYANFLILRDREAKEEGEFFKQHNVVTTRLDFGFKDGISQSEANQAFGEPDRVLTFENYRILVYEYDISTKLNKR